MDVKEIGKELFIVYTQVLDIVQRKLVNKTTNESFAPNAVEVYLTF